MVCSQHQTVNLHHLPHLLPSYPLAAAPLASWLERVALPTKKKKNMNDLSITLASFIFLIHVQNSCGAAWPECGYDGRS